MFEAQYAFGPATRLQAQAIGEPGHRTFRLLVESDDGRAAALWVEKEQLQALGLAVEQLLAEFQGKRSGARRRANRPWKPFRPTRPSTSRLVAWRLARTRASSKAVRATCCWCTTSRAAAPRKRSRPQPATFACRATREQLRALSKNIAEVVAAGRPRCPLCGEPMDSQNRSHGCVRTNGHHT